MFELVNIFELFLPQLLAYPNPKDPLNVDAANLLNHCPEEYVRTVRRYTLEYAVTDREVRPHEEEACKRLIHKVSTDCEDSMSEELSGCSQLSELSDTSDILFEEEIL